MKIIGYYKSLVKYNGYVKQLTGRSRMTDLLLSRIIKGVPYPLYVDLCFYDKSWGERDGYILDYAKYAMRYNPGVTRTNHDDKRDLIQKYLPYLKRNVLQDTQSMQMTRFREFVAQCDGSFFYKPYDGDSGVGIKKYIVDDQNIDSIYGEIKNSKPGILEETIRQHPDMDKLNPAAVSTIRFLVFNHKDGPKIVFATLRTSCRRGVVVDNAGAGGCFANIDLAKGEIWRNAYSECVAVKNIDDTYRKLLSMEGLERHPLTGTQFMGFKIPCFDEARDMVLEIANNVDFYGRRLIGYDVAISTDGPLIVEVNANRPGLCELLQIARKDAPMTDFLEDALNEA